jgi:acyl carrier protein
MSTMKSEIREYMISYLKENSEAGMIDGNDIDKIDLFGSGIMSSLGFMDLIVAIEGRFNIEIDFEEADPSEFSTFAGLVSMAVQAAEN